MRFYFFQLKCVVICLLRVTSQLGEKSKAKLLEDRKDFLARSLRTSKGVHSVKFIIIHHPLRGIYPTDMP